MIFTRYLKNHQLWHYCLLMVAVAAPFVWWSLPAATASTLFIPVWLVSIQLIFAGSLEAAKLKRRAWLGQYLKVTSPWHILLRGGVVMVIFHQMIGAVMAIIMLVSLRRLSVIELSLVYMAVMLFMVLIRCINIRLYKHIVPGYLEAVTRRLAVSPVAVMLTIGLVVVAISWHQPYMVETSWEVALQENLARVDGQTLLGALERMESAIEITGFWAMQNVMDNLGVSGVLKVLGWGLFFLMSGAFSWSLVRFLAGCSTLYDWLIFSVKNKKKSRVIT